MKGHISATRIWCVLVLGLQMASVPAHAALEIITDDDFDSYGPNADYSEVNPWGWRLTGCYPRTDINCGPFMEADTNSVSGPNSLSGGIPGGSNEHEPFGHADGP